MAVEGKATGLNDKALKVTFANKVKHGHSSSANTDMKAYN